MSEPLIPTNLELVLARPGEAVPLRPGSDVTVSVKSESLDLTKGGAKYATRWRYTMKICHEVVISEDVAAGHDGYSDYSKARARACILHTLFNPLEARLEEIRRMLYSSAPDRDMYISHKIDSIIKEIDEAREYIFKSVRKEKSDG